MHRTVSRLSSALLIGLFFATSVQAAPGEVGRIEKISATYGGFEGELLSYGFFGVASANLGDLDGDGVVDLAVGARDGMNNGGRVWILFLNSDGTVKHEQLIGEGAGGFSGGLQDSDYFGASLASLGDFDGDGVTDLLVGAPGRTGAGIFDGAVFVLLLNSDGTVKSHQEISSSEGGFGGGQMNAMFGDAVASIGDLDGDGTGDIAVGASSYAEVGCCSGAVWILFLNPDGTVKSARRISTPYSGFNQSFGDGLASLGDHDGDGVVDIAVGASGNVYRGRVWILFLNTDGTVKASQQIDETTGGFTDTLSPTDHFREVGALGDIDGDGVRDLAVGATNHGDAAHQEAGALWILFLNSDGTVKGHQKIGHEDGGCPQLVDGSDFGRSPTSLGDLDGDGLEDLVVGVSSNDGVFKAGALRVLFLGQRSSPLVISPPADSLEWCPMADPSGYDVIRGSLASLQATGGDFAASDLACLADDHPSTSISPLPDTGPGQADWFLVRYILDGVPGTYDTGSATQVAGRDAAIDAAAASCP